MDALRRSLEESPIVPIGEYQYVVHPVTDGLPLVEPALLEAVVAEITKVVDFGPIDKIVAPEAMGIHLATALSLETRVPFVVVRKRRYDLDGEVALDQSTAYGGSQLYLNGIDADDRVVFVDDMYSSGGTVEAVCSAILDVGAELADIVVVFNRGEVETDLPVPVTTLLELEVQEGRVVIDRQV